MHRADSNESKVYTIAEESKYATVENVPPYQLEEELKAHCMKFANVDRYACPRIQRISQSGGDTESFAMEFASVADARKVKKGIHKKSFYGFELRMRYEPEKETWEETMRKLQGRQVEFQSLGQAIPRVKRPEKPVEGGNPVPVKRRRI